MQVTDDPGWHARIDQIGSNLLNHTGEAVLDDARTIVPVSRDGSNGNPPGTLRASLRMARSDFVARIGSDLDYSVWVEEGHRVAYRGADGATHYTGAVVPPESYLRPALFRERDL